jgi:hypothetical protein
MKRLSLWIAILLLLGAPQLWGQGSQVAQISGTVKDSSDAAVPGAEVTVTHTGTGISRSVVTANDGTYIIPNLPVGPYKLQITLQGFATYVQEGIVLQVNTNPTINPVLKVGSITDQVLVEANASMVETRITGVGQVIDQERVVELPLNGRQVSQLVTLSGGSQEFVPTSAGQSLVSNKNYPTVAAFSVAGGQGGQTLFLLDGTVNMDPMSNVGLPLPFPDALQEFKLETSSLPANYGMAPGGVVNVVTKSGGNEIHGDAFEFLRNYAFNARNFFAPTRDSLKRNQFGGTIGGPIIKKRIFIFGGYQGSYEKVSPANNINYVATAATLQGDFTSIASPACNGGKPITLKAPFVNNKVDPALLNPVALKLLKYMPTSTDPCGKLTYGIPNQNHENQFVIKSDWQLTDRQSMFARYFFTDYQHPPYFTDNLLTTSTDPSAGLAGRVQTAVLGHTFTMSSNTVSVFRAGYTRSSMIRYLPDNVPTPTQLGSKVMQQSAPYLNIGVTNYFTVACTNCNPGPWVSNNYHLSEDLSMIRKAHQISMGMNLVYSRLDSLGSFQMNGIFSFNGQTTGNSLADMMIGKPASFGQDNGQIGHERMWIPSLYAHDNWRINPHLTANFGIRWDPYLLPYHAQNKASIFDVGWFSSGVKSKVYPNAPAGTLFYGDSGMPGASYAFHRLAEFAPRAGLVYDPRGKGQETIRIGYGVFYATTPLFLQLGLHAPYTVRLSIPSPTGGFSDPYNGSVYGSSPFPYPDPPPSNTTFPLFSTLGMGSFKAHIKPTYMEQWNIALQKQLPGDWMISATYLGNRTVHLSFNEPNNPAYYIPGNCVPGQYGLTAAGPCSTTGNINYRRALYLSNPAEGKYYGGFSNFGDGANANYSGLLLSAQHRFARNFSILANHTWSHCMTESEVGLNGSGAGQDPNNRAAEYGNCLAGRRHTFNLTSVLKTPKFSDRTVQAIFGNWQASTIFTAMTGSYMTASLGVDNSLTGGADRPNLAGNPNLTNPTYMKWFDTSMFTRPATGAFGTAGRGIIVGPGAWNLDLALTRAFPITESQRIDFRAEIFNIFNHTRFGNPITTFTSGVFGQIQSARDPRIMQFALKYTF